MDRQSEKKHTYIVIVIVTLLFYELHAEMETISHPLKNESDCLARKKSNSEKKTIVQERERKKCA